MPCFRRRRAKSAVIEGTIYGIASLALAVTVQGEPDRTQRDAGKTTVSWMVPQAIAARTNYAAMRAYHRNHPDVQAVVAPYRKPPPPDVIPLEEIPANGTYRERIERLREAPRATPDGSQTDDASEPLRGPRQDRQAPSRLALRPPERVAPAPPLIASFQGTVDSGSAIPPDTMGAVGPDHVVEILNSGFTIFNRTGGLVAPEISLEAFFSGLGTSPGDPASDAFDPKVLFDQYSGRFVVGADGNPDARDGVIISWVLIGISQTPDPTGDWNLFAIRADVPGVDDCLWADYPGLGVDPHNVVITNNMFAVSDPGCVGGSFHPDVWVIDKAALIAATGPLVAGVDYNVFHDPCGAINFSGATFQPSHTFGQTPATAINHILHQGIIDTVDTERRFLRRLTITGVGGSAILGLGADPCRDYVEIDGYSFGLADAPQADCDTDIATNDPRLLNVVTRNNKIWTTHSVGGSGAIPSPGPALKPEVAWYEIDPASFGPFPGGVPIQQGRVSHPTLHFYFPSIAVNKDECVALGFSGSDDSTYASGYYTVRFPADPPGTTQPVELLRAGEDAYWKQFTGTRNRWGDYSATVVDPIDDETFWTAQEYATGQFPSGKLDVNSPLSIADTYDAPPASFGPALTPAGMTGDVALAEPNEACSAITNPAAVDGKVALVDRGSCFFSTKVKNCQDAGAIAVIVANNVADPPFRMSAGTADVITIPSAMVSQADGLTIRTEAAGGSTVNVRLYVVVPVTCEAESGRWATWWGAFSCAGECGDGVVNADEECDNGLGNSDTEPDGCRTDCQAAGCGDNVVDSGEDCDDGNTVGADGCSSDCLFDAPPPLEGCTNDFALATNGAGGERLSRFGCVSAPELPAVAGGGGTAIRVTFRTLLNTDPGDPDGAGVCPPRSLLTSPPPSISQFEGQTRWLGAPVEIVDEALPTPPNYIGAPLVCTAGEAAVRDWSPAGLTASFGGDTDASRIYFYGSPVVPCSVYEVSHCNDPLNEDSCSDLVLIFTSRMADAWPPFAPAPGQPSFTDINTHVNKYKGIPFTPGNPPLGGAPEWHTLEKGNVVGDYDVSVADRKVGFLDIGVAVEGYKGIPYKEPGPCNPGTALDDCGNACSTAP